MFLSSWLNYSYCGISSRRAGGFIGSAGVAGLVSVFVLGRREQQRNQSLPQLESSDPEEDKPDTN